MDVPRASSASAAITAWGRTARRRTIWLAAMLVVLAALLAAPRITTAHAAELETRTFVSGESDGVCIDPVGGFEPTVAGETNFAPLASTHAGAFPSMGAACRVQSPSRAVDVPPTAPVISEFWRSPIPGTSWVGTQTTGEDTLNPPPRYYIYTATFELCANQVPTAQAIIHMFADDRAGAFINGRPVGSISAVLPSGLEALESPPGPTRGWVYTSQPGTQGGFVAGTNSLQFVVLDTVAVHTGVDYSAAISVQACQAEAFGPSGVIQAPPSKQCVSKRSFLIHIRRYPGLVYRSVTVDLNGRQVQVIRGRRISSPINFRGLPRGTYVVRIAVLTTTGLSIAGTRTYHTCRSRPLRPHAPPKL